MRIKCYLTKLSGMTFAHACILFIGALLFSEVNSLMFHLQPSGQKCLREEIHKDVLVSGDYEITEVPGQTVDLAVRSRFFIIISRNI